MSSKQRITQKILEGLPENDRPTLDEALQTWWMNFRDGGGLRLTQHGFLAISTFDIETYKFDVPPGLVAKPGPLLTLDRKLDCPYFIKLGKQPQLIVFGSKQAMMLAMYNDLEKFLKYLARQ
jgi:hypothetical protein